MVLRLFARLHYDVCDGMHEVIGENMQRFAEGELSEAVLGEIETCLENTAGFAEDPKMRSLECCVDICPDVVLTVWVRVRR